MSGTLQIPPSIAEVIQSFDQNETSFTVHDVHQALVTARKQLQESTEDEGLGSWAEALAFALVEDTTGYRPWRTYFAPLHSATNENGETFYSPDIAEANPDFLRHWASRARELNHPVLRARYADLVWEMTPVIAGERRDVAMARCAIDAYVSSSRCTVLPDLRDRFGAAHRAFDLSCLIHDEQRTACAKELLLRLHREAIESQKDLWWLAYNRFSQDNFRHLTDEERKELVDSLEALVLHFGDTSDPAKFNPHDLEDCARKLIQHYRKLGQQADVHRLNVAIARSFEHFAGLGDAMVASSVLQTAVNAYRDAGQPEDSSRVRVLMEGKIRQAATELVPVVTEFEISRDDMDKFSAAIVDEDLAATFARLANEFLPNSQQLESQVRKSGETAPLLAHIPQSIMADDHVAGAVGSVEDDQHGRLIQQAAFLLRRSDIWLGHAFEQLFATHEVVPEHFVAWANRPRIFRDTSFVLEGVRAWFAGDLVKALFVLVPQAESGLRGIIGQLGQPVTKAHSAVPGVGVALSMGDILYRRELCDALGPDLTLFFQALFADPRGINLRNDVAHGLIKHDQVTEQSVRLLIHTLLVFGIWRELAEKRR